MKQLDLFPDIALSGLRPFFSYYGGKWRSAAKLYPKPIYGTVIEPFAGSAGYSLRYADREVILCDADPIIRGIWRYLIAAKESEILAIPDVDIGGTVDDLPVCQEARWLVGFWLSRATSSPRKSPSKWMRQKDERLFSMCWGDRVRTRIAAQITHIRHWRVIDGSYIDSASVVDGEATWFIDPPYQIAGSHYRYGSGKIDYSELACWCRSLNGQVVVCENEGANWLPFNRLAEVNGSSKRSVEAIWVK